MVSRRTTAFGGVPGVQVRPAAEAVASVVHATGTEIRPAPTD